MTMKMAILPGGGKEEASAAPSSSSYSSTSSNAKSPTSNKGAPPRPRPPALWTVNECKLWLGRHCGDLGVQYSELFHQNNVNGRGLLRMNSVALERMGISNAVHRQEIWREIIKLKLKSDVLELRDLESQLASHK
ncbi:unnamed protein product [Orchesella dallaii]|uniref:SAM domain-containing protein n=1 Tax=Orchesella dallaii TaxID=48710 RepID=A0ABP1QEJ8_9HEXA